MANTPNFMDPTSRVEKIRGREMRFFSISSKALKRLKPLAGPASRAIDAVLSGQDFDVRQKAIAGLLEAVASNVDVACLVVLDALREETWVKRPITEEAVDEFFVSVDGPTLAAMLAAVIKVNKEAFGPLFPVVAPAAEGAETGAKPETAGVS